MSDLEADNRPTGPEFVRGKFQLAPYSPEMEVTGHRLTAFEAKDAYGEALLQEAIDFGSAILVKKPGAAADALRRQREELGVPLDEASKLLHLPVEQIEDDDNSIGIAKLETLGLKLGLDERLLSVEIDAGADRELGVRLRTLQAESQQSLSSRTVLNFAEAASLVRIQTRMNRWLGLPVVWDDFDKTSDYGSASHPAFKVGYELAEIVRKKFDLGGGSISSMRELVEADLGIPVFQQSLPDSIAGATISNGNERGIILNTEGKNSSVFVRRSTLAHELGHLLFDPAQNMRNITVDLYDQNDLDPETGTAANYVEQRANAFAITFLAPPDAVRDLVQTPIKPEAVASVMQTFGISVTAATYHIRNSFYRNYDVPDELPRIEADQHWLAAENYALDFFKPAEVPHNRRGRFAGLVAACFQRGLISADTAALYLDCTVDAFEENVEIILELYPIEN